MFRFHINRSNTRRLTKRSRGKSDSRRQPLFMPLEPRQMLAGDLVAHWQADDLVAALPEGGTVETAWVDRVQGAEASAQGTPALSVSGLGGRPSVQFDSSDGSDYFFVDSSASPLTKANDFSVAVVFETDSQSLTGDGSGTWFANTGIVDANTGGFGSGWGLSTTSDGRLATGMGGGLGVAPQTVYSAETGTNDGQYHVVVVTHASGTLGISIDGGVATEISNAPSGQRTNLDLAIGALAAGGNDGNGFIGDIAQVRVYNGALDAAEQASLYNELNGYYSNQAPVAVADSYDHVEDGGLLLEFAPGVLANDTDADGDPLTAHLVTDVSHGSLGLSENGQFLYTPDRDFFGTDSFTYVARDFRDSEPVTVTLNVAPAYDAPRPLPDQYLMDPGGTLNLPALVGLMVNDENPDGGDVTVELADAVNGGTLDLRPDGSFLYTPGDFTGIARFTYRLNDGVGLSDPAEVIIAVNTPPQAVDDQFVVTEDVPLVLSPTEGPLANDIDPEADNVLQVTLIEPPEIGELVLESDGSLTYTPPENVSGETSFVYRVSDGFESSGEATATLVIQAVNDAPVAQAESYIALSGRALQIPAAVGVLSNDLDVEGDTLTATITSEPVNGTLVFNDDGSFRYTPNAGYIGEDPFQYVAHDADGTSEPVTVTLLVGVSPIRISEVMTQNTATYLTRLRDEPDGRFRGDMMAYDWIELENTSPNDLNLGGLHLTDNRDDSTRWRFPADATIPGNGRIVVFASGLDVQDAALDENTSYHTNFGVANGEYLAVTSYDGSVIDQFAQIPNPFTDISYGIDQNGDPRYFSEPTPGEPNGVGQFGQATAPEILLAAGFYESAQQVEITVPLNTTVYYTLDGSVPTLTNGMLYEGPFTVDQTSTVRAVGLRDQYLTSDIDTHTFLFLNDVIRQSADGSAPEGWPDRPVRGQVFDYGMDPEVVDDPVWGPQIIEALTQIPTISLVTELGNLVDSDTGIYVRATSSGRAWERDVSVELINPDGSDGFQIDAGLRIRGGFSRGSFNPKHSFRLFFRNDYDGTLEFPLFDSEGENEFSNVDLRTAQNYAWSNDTFNDETRNSFLRDIYSRDLQRDMGQHYTRGRYYHLYLNGQYWGMYQTEERPEASYAETYIGGNSDNYDVIKASGGTLEATDGELEPWRELWEIARAGFDFESYYAVQGKNPDGTDNPDLEVHVLAEELIDFTINYTFTGNEDMPTSLGGGGANNFWAIRNPDSRDGWLFIAHDNEHNMLDVNEDQTGTTTTGRTFNTFNPHYLHQEMMAVSEYRLKFADRVQELFFNDGPLVTENAQARMQTRVEQIDQAIIAESARWGDQHNEPALTKENWSQEVDWLMNTFLGSRTDIVLNQYRRRGLFSEIEAASFSQHGGLVDSGYQLTLAAPAGTIYYTVGKNDPRLIGGAISPNAIEWTGQPITLDADTTVTARVWTGTEWSPLTQATFEVGVATGAGGLRVSEINYHPSEPSEREAAAGYTDQNDFEFVELVNPTDQPIDLSQVRFVRVQRDGDLVGIDFDFANSSIQRLAPGERVVVVEDHGAFRMRYGNDLPIAGVWSGRLSNSDEMLSLFEGEALLQQFSYSDDWAPASDGEGYTLTMVDVAAQDLSLWSRAEGWAVSTQIGGSPGEDETVVGDVNRDGRFDSGDLEMIFAAGEYEDGIVGNSSEEEGDFDGDGDFTTADLVFAFQFGQYLP